MRPNPPAKKQRRLGVGSSVYFDRQSCLDPLRVRVLAQAERTAASCWCESYRALLLVYILVMPSGGRGSQDLVNYFHGHFGSGADGPLLPQLRLRAQYEKQPVQSTVPK